MALLRRWHDAKCCQCAPHYPPPHGMCYTPCVLTSRLLVCLIPSTHVPQVAAQPEEAIELYMAADRPRQALAILNQQLSSAMERGVEEAVSGMGVAGGAGEHCQEDEQKRGHLEIFFQALIHPTPYSSPNPTLPPPPEPPPCLWCLTADVVNRIATRGRDACAKISSASGAAAADIGSRREVESFQQLGLIWELLVATRKGRCDQVRWWSVAR